MDAARKRMTVEEFLDWVDTQPEGKFELVQGVPLKAMSNDTVAHARCKFAAGKAFDRAIQRAGLQCEAFVDGLSVKIDAETSFGPDALVNCGPVLPPGAKLAANPVIVVEALSPSTERRDRNHKVASYLQKAEIHHVLLLDTELRRVQHFRRLADGTITFAYLASGTLQLDPPGLSVMVDEFFP